MSNATETKDAKLKVEIVKQEPEEFATKNEGGEADAPANKSLHEQAPVFVQEPKSENKGTSSDGNSDDSQKNSEKKSDADHTLKQNPNPRANANVPETDKQKPESTEGPGTEITDGEAG